MISRWYTHPQFRSPFNLSYTLIRILGVIKHTLLVLSLRIAYHFTNSVLIFFTFIFFSLPLSLLHGSTFFLDATLRVASSSPFLETYSFWWTALTYLAPFFYLIVLILVYWCLRHEFFTTLHFYALLFGLYLFESIDYLPLNFNEVSTSYSDYGLNVLLTNALNKYHPFIFYLSTVMMFVALVFFTLLWFEVPYFSSNWHLNGAYSIGWWAISLNLTALFMGSWWALQEGTWGGWWNWDSSEVLGLEVSLLVLFLLHTIYPHYRLANVSIRSWILVFGFISSYFFIQVNFELVSHNFGSKFFFFFNNNLFSLEVIFTTFVMTLLLVKFSLHNYRRTISHLFKTALVQSTITPFRNLALKLVPYIIIIFWIFWSYRPLWNYFIWNFLGINIFNSEHSLQSAHLILALTLLVWLIQNCPRLIFLLCVVISTTGNWLWVLALAIPLSFFNVQLHSLLLIFSLLNLTLSEVVSSFWFSQPNYLGLVSLPMTTWLEAEYLSADSSSCEVVLSHGALNGTSQLSWNLVTSSNITNVNFFILEVSSTACNNYYNLGLSYVITYLKLELPLISTLVSVFGLVVGLATFARNNSPKTNF